MPSLSLQQQSLIADAEAPAATEGSTTAVNGGLQVDEGDDVHRGDVGSGILKTFGNWDT